MAHSVNNVAVERGAEVEDPEVLVELGFGETIPHPRLIAHVSVSSTWQQVLEKYGLQVSGDDSIIIVPESGHWIDEMTKDRPMGHLLDKVGELMGKINSFRDLQVVRVIKDPACQNLTWKAVYAKRLGELVKFPVLAGLVEEDYVHFDIVRNLNSSDSFQTTIEINHERPDVLPKYIYHMFGIIADWQSSRTNFHCYADYGALAQHLLLHAKKFLFSRNIQGPLLDLQLYMGLRKCYAEKAWKPSSTTVITRVFLTTKDVETVVASCRVILTLMNFEKRRVLHCLLYTLDCMLNHKFLREIEMTSDEVIRTFMPLVVNYDEDRAIELIDFLVKHFDAIFDTRDEINILNGVACTMASASGHPPTTMNNLKIKPAGAASTVTTSNQYCLRNATVDIEGKNAETLDALREVFDGIVQMPNEKKKKKMLLEFKAKFPEIFAEKNGDEQLALTEEAVQLGKRRFQSGTNLWKGSWNLTALLKK